MTLAYDDDLDLWLHPWHWPLIVYICNQTGGILDYFVVSLI